MGVVRKHVCMHAYFMVWSVSSYEHTYMHGGTCAPAWYAHACVLRDMLFFVLRVCVYVPLALTACRSQTVIPSSSPQSFRQHH